MLIIDGSFGEGGGQVLRSSLALAMLTGRPVRIEKIRAGRKKPGLMRQHWTAVQAAARVCHARVTGAELHATELTFEPNLVTPGEFHFAIGSAGSTTLVLQTVLPALLCANGPSTIVLEGGTHNPFAPPFEFLANAYFPLINRMGPNVTAELERPGFFPGGGGKLAVHVQPAAHLNGFDLLERGNLRNQRATALVANLPRHIADRELTVVGTRLGWLGSQLVTRELRTSHGPGNVLILEVESQHVTEVFTGFGQRGVRAETVADETANAVRDYLAAGVPVGEHLADQLLLPLALAGHGSFRTQPLSLHATTQIELIRKFLDVTIATESAADDTVTVRIGHVADAASVGQ